MTNTLPPRIKPRKTYPVGKAARKDLISYLSDIGNHDAWTLLILDEYKDYDWTTMMDESDEFYRMVDAELRNFSSYFEAKQAVLKKLIK